MASKGSSKGTAQSEEGVTENEITTEVKPKGKPGRKPKVTSMQIETPVVKVEIVDESSQFSAISETSTGLDSPGKRQRRKPKRFEEYEDLEKPKSRPSLVKVAEETVKGSRGKNSKAATTASSDAIEVIEDDESKERSNPEEVLNVNSPKKSPSVRNNAFKGRKGVSKQGLKKKMSEGDAPKNSLITSYFKKNEIKVETEDQSDLDMDISRDSEEFDDPAATTSKLSLQTYANKGRLSSSRRQSKSVEPEATSDERNGKKRSFDDILSSHVSENTIETTEPSENGGEVDGLDKNTTPKPARKSSRASSKARK